VLDEGVFALVAESFDCGHAQVGSEFAQLGLQRVEAFEGADDMAAQDVPDGDAEFSRHGHRGFVAAAAGGHNQAPLLMSMERSLHEVRVREAYAAQYADPIARKPKIERRIAAALPDSISVDTIRVTKVKEMKVPEDEGARSEARVNLWGEIHALLKFSMAENDRGQLTAAVKITTWPLNLRTIFGSRSGMFSSSIWSVIPSC